MSKLYKALVQERAELVAEQKKLLAAVEAREPMEYTADERKRDDEIGKRLEAVAPQIASEETRRLHEREAVALPEAKGNITAVRDRAADKPFATFGEQLRAVAQAGMNPHNTDTRLFAVTGASESVGADGGFLVQQDFANELLYRAYTTGEILKRVTKTEVGPGSNGLSVNTINETSRATGSRWGGIQMYWLNEGGTKTASRPALRRFQLILEKVAGLYVATDELLQDATALQSIVTDAFSKEIEFVVEDAIINGNGAGKPLGILNSSATISVAKESGQGAATFTYVNALDMYSRFWAGSRKNAVWLVSQGLEAQLWKMNFPVGATALPPQFVTYRPDGTLTMFGREVIPVEYMPALGTTGDVLLTDLSEYRLIDKGGVQQAQSIHVYFATDETAFRFVYRVNGAPFWSSVLTPYTGSNTLSPYVKLDTRA